MGSIPQQVAKQSFEFNPVQLVALEMLKRTRNTLLYGGSRSGKTFFIIYIMVLRALKFPESRHIILRLRFNHAKVSIWMDTLPKVLKVIFGSGNHSKYYTVSKSEYFIRFENGSEIWIDGLDDKERVEKILGREYNTMFFNEISQIPYDSVLTALTRLSLNIQGCINRAYYDCNPAGRGHWGYKLFILKLNPEDLSPVKNPQDYNSLRMNPIDNAINLTPGYIENILNNLPEAKRKRFRDGEWADAEHVIFKNWDVVEEIPEDVRRRAWKSTGLDFGYTIDPTAVIDVYQYGKELYLEEKVYQTGMSNNHIKSELRRLGYQEHETIFADSAEKKSIDDIHGDGFNIKPCVKGPDSIKFGIDHLYGYNIHITRKSANLITEFQSYTWTIDKNGKIILVPVDDFNHGIDAVRYAMTPRMKKGASVKSVFE